MSETLRGQELIPGLDVVALVAGGVARRAQAQDERRIDRAVRVQTMKELQERAWTEHCERVIGPRQETWESIAQHLRAAPPSQRNYRATSWQFTAQQPVDQSMVELHTSVTLTAHEYGEGWETRKYLDRPVIGKACPDELLGVPAQGKRGKRRIPLEPLQQAHDLLLIDRADDMKAQVTAGVLGSTRPPETLFEVSLSGDYHDPNNRRLHFYMEPEHAHLLVDWNISDDAALIERLHERSAQARVDEQYEQLRQIGEILLQSSPA